MSQDHPITDSELADLLADLSYHERMVERIRRKIGAAAPIPPIPPVARPSLVEPRDACPGCGERDPDRLEWQSDDEHVRCASCGLVYVPGEHPTR